MKDMEMSLMKNEIQEYLNKLFPISRSITGNGNRQTLKILQEIIPIKIREIKSGKKVYDWKIPKEWNISDAYIKDKYGNVLISYKNNNLHVMSYSIPINKKMNWRSLKEKLIFSDVNSKAIPYRTSYYKKDWSFCVSKEQYNTIKNSKGPFKVVIKSEFKNGSLTYADYVIRGKSKKEILISTYFCHPSMANDSLSGLILTAFLAKKLKERKLNWTYRFVFVPETIGAIAYCSVNSRIMKNIDAGMVITTVGGPGKFAYKQSFDKKHQINIDIEKVLKQKKIDYLVYPFSIRGSDERQYSSQAFRINTATITKDKYFEYKEYHTSLDNLDFVTGININKSLKLYYDLVLEIEKWKIYKTNMVNCEYMMSKRNLYNKLGGAYKTNKKGLTKEDLIQWVLFESNGEKTVDQIARELRTDKRKIYNISKFLERKKLLSKVN